MRRPKDDVIARAVPGLLAILIYIASFTLPADLGVSVPTAHAEKGDVPRQSRAVDVSFPATGSQVRQRLTGALYRPEIPGRVPGVILLHECAGITATLHHWGATLQRWGYAALLVDSFGPRNQGDLCGRSGSPTISTQHERMPDAYAAKRYLGAEPFVDTNRIAVMGWGHGG